MIKNTLGAIGGGLIFAAIAGDMIGFETNRKALKKADTAVSRYFDREATVDETVSAINGIFGQECQRQQDEDSIVPFVSKKVHYLSWDNTLSALNRRIEQVVEHSGAEVCSGPCEPGSFEGRRIMTYDKNDGRWYGDQQTFMSCHVADTFPSRD